MGSAGTKLSENSTPVLWPTHGNETANKSAHPIRRPFNRPFIRMRCCLENAKFGRVEGADALLKHSALPMRIQEISTVIAFPVFSP